MEKEALQRRRGKSVLSFSIRPAKDVDIEGFLKFAKALGDIPGVWGKDPRSDFYDHLKEMKEEKIMFLLAILD